MATTPGTSSTKLFTPTEIEELAKDSSKCIVIVHDDVYDVTEFLHEHPGGDDVLKEQHGRDASRAFEDVSHSGDARDQMKAFKIGKLSRIDVPKSCAPKITPSSDAPNAVNQEDSGSPWSKWIVPLVIAVAAVVLFKLLANPQPNGN